MPVVSDYKEPCESKLTRPSDAALSSIDLNFPQDWLEADTTSAGQTRFPGLWHGAHDLSRTQGLRNRTKTWWLEVTEPELLGNNLNQVKMAKSKAEKFWKRIP